MAARRTSTTAGAVYDGPMAVFDGEEVGFVKAFYALDKSGKNLLLKSGKPVRLVHVDLAPGDDDDGSQEFRVAGPKDPPQIAEPQNVVELEPDTPQGAAQLDPAGGS